MRQSTSALAAIMAAIVSFAADAAPLATAPSPAEPIASHMSLLHRVLIYAKEGSRKLIDGRWNLGQSETKLGITVSAEETKQLMACTGRIICEKRDGGEVFASASSVLRPDLLVTAKHVFSQGRGGAVSFKWCSFRSFLHRNAPVPIRVDKDQRKGYFLNNEDFIVVRLKRALKDCAAFAINNSDFSLAEGEEVFSATSHQNGMLNKVSRREPVVAKGAIRSVSRGFLGGPPFYYADVDLDEGGSGGAVFALKDGRPVTDDAGRLVQRGILVAHGPRAKNGKPYSEDQNYTIIIGLQGDFRDLVEGKARTLVGMEPAFCPHDEAAEIEVIQEPVAAAPADMLAPFLRKKACRGETDTDCIAAELKELAKGIETLAVSSRTKDKHQFKLKNDTRCAICFTYNRCNDYGCWDEAVRASGKSILFAGVGERAPIVKNPQFCMQGGLLADWRPPLPLRKPILPPPPPAGAVASEAAFVAAKEKAKREGVWTLTAEDIRGLSLEQISELRGY